MRELRERRPQVASREIPREVLDFAPQAPMELNFKLFSICLRSAPAGSSPGPGGCTNEMLKVCLDDQETLQLLYCAADEFARGDVPRGVGHCFTLATLTALQKKDGGVRGIATGTTFRRLVAKTLAKQFSKQVEAACAPFQFALSTRAGVDCVMHAERVMTERTQMRHSSPSTELERTTMCSGAMMAKLFEVPGLLSSCRLSGPFTPSLPDTCGKTKR